MHVERGNVITPREIIIDGALAIRDGVVTYAGTWGDAPAEVRASKAPPDSGRYLAPPLVDVHNHGGAGASFPDAASPAEVRTAVAQHRGHGTGRVLASLVTAAPETLLERIEILAEAADAGEIAGIHLEGPFLSAARCGAQDPRYLIPADPALTAELLARGRGHVATMTIAPESPRAREVVEVLIGAGALPSFGHTDADSGMMRSAIAHANEVLAGTGRRPTITHLFNGMRPIHHREPGPIPPALAAARRGEIVAEIIGDGVHLAPHLVGDLFDLLGADNIALVTDAMAATGMADGDYRLGSLDVRVGGGVARLAGGDAIAGGTSHLLDVVRTTVASGVPLVDAIRSATLVPARILDPEATFGALVEGGAGEYICLDEELRLIDG